MEMVIEDREIVIIPENPQDKAYLDVYFQTTQAKLKPVEFPAGSSPAHGVYDKICLVITSCPKE